MAFPSVAQAGGTACIIDGEIAEDVRKLAILSVETPDKLNSIKEFIARDVPQANADRLMAVLLRCSDLEILKLASCHLTDSQLHSIITRHPTLKVLALHDNDLTSAAIPPIMTLGKLISLDLSNNVGLGVELADLSTHRSLEELDISYIPTVAHCVNRFVRPECKLKSLKVAECGIDSATRSLLNEKFPEIGFVDEGELEARILALVDSLRAEERDSSRMSHAEAVERWGPGYYGYCMDRAHLEEMNRSWNS